MNLEDMDDDARYGFLLGLNLGFFFKARGLNEEIFMNFCKGVWETIEMQPDWEKTRDMISNYMANQIPKNYEEWQKSKK